MGIAILFILTFWFFGYKYWVVSKKVQLMEAMLPIEKKLDLYSNVTIGIGLSIVVFIILSAIPEFMSIANYENI